MEKIFVAIIACCFKNKGQLCPTCIKRMDVALEYSANLLDRPEKVRRFIVTGDVPYEKGGMTMAALQKQYLMAKRIAEKDIEIGYGVGIFSESQLIARHIWSVQSKNDSKKIYVVSSNWYFWPGRPIWKKALENCNHKLVPVVVYGAGGVITYITYFIYTCLYWSSRLVKLDWLMDKFLTKFQSSRVNGFKLKHCA